MVRSSVSRCGAYLKIARALLQKHTCQGSEPLLKSRHVRYGSGWCTLVQNVWHLRRWAFPVEMKKSSNLCRRHFSLSCFDLLLVNLFVSKVEISKYNLRLFAPIYLSQMIEFTPYIPNEQFSTLYCRTWRRKFCSFVFCVFHLEKVPGKVDTFSAFEEVQSSVISNSQFQTKGTCIHRL